MYLLHFNIVVFIRCIVIPKYESYTTLWTQFIQITCDPFLAFIKSIKSTFYYVAVWIHLMILKHENVYLPSGIISTICLAVPLVFEANSWYSPNASVRMIVQYTSTWKPADSTTLSNTFNWRRAASIRVKVVIHVEMPKAAPKSPFVIFKN